MIVLSSEEENALLESPDGTCANGNECREVVDLSRKVSGRSIKTGMMCVLCCRYYVTKCWGNKTRLSRRTYRNYEDEYNKSVFVPFTPEIGITFPIVRYDAPTPLDVHGSTLRKLFNKYECNNAPSDQRWHLSYCEKCQRICNSIDRKHSIGFDGIMFDIERNVRTCKKCSTPIKDIACDEFGLVCYENNWYCKCYLCNTMTTCKRLRTVPICDNANKVDLKGENEDKIVDCTDVINQLMNKSNKRCFYCEMVLNDKKRFTTYSIKDDDDTVQVYLCKMHTIPRRLFTKFKKMFGSSVFDRETFYMMLSQKKRTTIKREIP